MPNTKNRLNCSPNNHDPPPHKKSTPTIILAIYRKQRKAKGKNYRGRAQESREKEGKKEKK
jgi:hypothetical protein